MKERRKFVYPQETMVAIEEICKYFSDYYKKGLTFHSEVHTFDDENNKQIYRAAPYYQGKPCYHWAEIDFSDKDEDETFPAQLRAFVDIQDLLVDNDIAMNAGIFALVQRAVPDEDEGDLDTDLWTAYVKPEVDPNDAGTAGIPKFGGLELVSIN